MTTGTKTDQEKAKELSDKIFKTVTDFKDSFQCQKCGKCCEEGSGVALWPHEFKRIQRLKKHIFRYITYLNNWHVLKMPCVFYNKRSHKCKIYDKRPIACRLYPLGITLDGSTRISSNCTAIKKEGSNE
jgi:hypothetical protein